jgi:DMSO/TMAO reductase YedYZ molybdopterin-dependent catalytic subunit
MISRTVAAIAALLLVSQAAAQSSATYRGTLRFTMFVTGALAGEVAQMTSFCAHAGETRPIDLQTDGAVVTVTSREPKPSATADQDGRFTIVTTGNRIYVRWSGTVRGRQIDGEYLVRAPGGECRATLSARR